MKKNILFYAIPVFLVAALTLGACQMAPTANAQTTTVPPTGSLRTLAVTGTGEVILVPDMAYINVGVHTEAENVSTAVADNNSQAAAITDAIVAMGVEEKDIQTSSFNVYSMNRYDNMGNMTGVNYAVDNTLYIIVRNLPDLSKILDAALTAGANQIYGINFDISDRQSARAQARDLAIKDAEAKALSVAETAGVALGQVHTINVTNASLVQPMAGYGIGGGGMAEAATSVPVSAGQIVISASADLVFEFGDK